nr:uncharacterized oxidoreductase At4g09670-like [Tanacetum cinerariifolium]
MISQVHSTFSYIGDENFQKNYIRVNPNLDSLGALRDAGWYSIRAILWAHDYELPNTVIALQDTEFNESGVILSCGASLNWTNDKKIVTFSCSFLSNLSMDIIATGTKGTLCVHDFIVPFNARVGPYFTVSYSKWIGLSCEPEPSEFRIPTVLIERSYGPSSNFFLIVIVKSGQEVLMVEEFARLVGGIFSGKAKPEKKWPMISRKTQAIIDAVVTSIKKGYEPVEVVY